MNTIQKLVSEFQTKHANRYTNEERVELIKNMVKNHGYDITAQATGYKMSTLNQITSGQNVSVADERVRQAVYVLNNLKSE